jgi:hypothetical protein
MLETINLCRPMHRDHALATALAEYEHETPPSSPAGAAVAAATTPAMNGSTVETKLMVDESGGYKAPKARPSSALSVFQQLCGSLNLSGPTPDNIAREVKLEHLLRHPVTLEIFKDTMIKDFNSENLMLYLDIRRYKVHSIHRYITDLTTSDL